MDKCNEWQHCSKGCEGEIEYSYNVSALDVKWYVYYFESELRLVVNV